MDVHPRLSGYWGPVTATLDWCEVRLSFPELELFHISLSSVPPVVRSTISSRTMWQKFPTQFPTFSLSSYLYTAHICHGRSPCPLVTSWDLVYVFRINSCPGLSLDINSARLCRAVLWLGWAAFCSTRRSSMRLNLLTSCRWFM